MKAFLRPWCLGAAMSALYALAIVLGFWRVLAPDVVFVAPDAPLAPLTFGEAVRQLFSTPPTLQRILMPSIMEPPFSLEQARSLTRPGAKIAPFHALPSASMIRLSSFGCAPAAACAFAAACSASSLLVGVFA